MTKNEFKELFLKLTEYTIPFGKESLLEKYLPQGFKKDSIGNYFYEIGNSETIFTTHLDTFSKNYEKVSHVIDPENEFIISTDEKTILGGDNKLGCSILIGMIQNNIPGTYYFFLGEEPILSGGVWGSTKALNSNPNYFKKFKRCIAFDRKQYGSIVTRQMGRTCCSQEFAKSIATELGKKGGIKWDKKLEYGYYTDTAVFMDVIPECTNISVGGFNEHYKTEWVNLNYTYAVFTTALKVGWEFLPTIRELEERFYYDNSIDKKYKKFKQKNIFSEIEKITKLLGLCKTKDILRGNKRSIIYSKWVEDYDLHINLIGDKIIIDNNEISMNDLMNLILIEFSDDVIEEIDYYIENESNKEVSNILKIFGFKSVEKLKEFIKKKKENH